ncbi:ElyC/SanA/YdcF family protein [Lapidilactobacillus mulanensis]|uniref:ElyC/SanA/YdcF family protein n=1 Tax=Lapidilactobacillus mulanensis TaxID=2485999 RepID=A0ABW4DKZ0_9LACO|nr:YdcF family protein [Lapidilactobacillus mulanensis]
MEQITAGQLERLVIIFGVITLVLLAIFLISWLKEPRRLINGVLFTLFFGVFLVELAILIFNTGNTTFITTMAIIFLVLVVLIAIVMAMSWALLLWNAVLVWKRESHVLANMLTLFLALFLIGIWVINIIGVNSFLPEWLNTLLGALSAVGLYLGFCVFNYLVNVVLYQFYPRNYRQDYLVVLGAGLLDGTRVSRLLGNRIDAAMKFADKQKAKGRSLPKIVFSGGQGPDEKVSEASAMADYAIAHGWPAELVLLEDASKNTLQNMQFSKNKIAADHQGKKQPRVKFFTNNYHTFRAGLYAKMAALPANGVGAPTRLYFLPNALIREFAAVFLLNKKRHAIIILGIIGIGVLLTIATILNGRL